MRTAAIGYKLMRLVLAITTPEVTFFDVSMMLLGWLMRRGPPLGV